MEVSKQRTALSVAFTHAEQVRVERVGGFSCGTCAIDRVRCAVENGSMLADEVFPRRFVSIRARRGERQVLELKR